MIGIGELHVEEKKGCAGNKQVCSLCGQGSGLNKQLFLPTPLKLSFVHREEVNTNTQYEKFNLNNMTMAN